MQRRRRVTVPIAELLRRSVPAEARGRLFSVDLLHDHWSDVVGGLLANRAEPYQLSEGVLTVRVSDVRWGQMVTRMAPEIIPKLNKAVGLALVRRINFARYAGPPVAPPTEDAKLQPAPEPLIAPRVVAEAAARLDDRELGQTLERVASRSLARGAAKGATTKGES